MDRHHKSHPHDGHHRYWRGRSVGIPKGFLTYGVLRYLSHQPMSGSEITDEIEEKTMWRPSPGSIYPLLAKLREEGSIELVESEEPGLKRFALTEKGREVFEEHKKRRGLFRKKYHAIRRMWLKIYEEMDEELYQANLRLFKAVEEIGPNLKVEAGGVSEKVRSILLRAAEEIEEIKEQLEE
jgi:DNA-binding PadR family transcriptional regulator